MTDPQRCFLVTCLGAYDDSGVGTGGFVCVHEGQALILDKIDSTGLCEHEGSYYRFARGLRTIAGYDASGLRYLLKAVSYTHLRAHETPEHLVCRLLLEK